VAEQLYDALLTWNSIGSLEVTPISLAFFQQFDSSVAAGTYASSSSTYATLTAATKSFADGMVEIVAKFTPVDGGLSEQFDKKTGAPLSAIDLTWSYASALTAFAARAGTVPASWGASGLHAPTACSFGPQPVQIPVTFDVNATTVAGGKCWLAFFKCFV
jgi:glucoamylase